MHITQLNTNAPQHPRCTLLHKSQDEKQTPATASCCTNPRYDTQPQQLNYGFTVAPGCCISIHDAAAQGS
jgi:hypothetical protein